VLIGALPAWSAARRAVTDTRPEGTRTIGERRGRLVRLGLSVAELALALVLVAGAGLLLRSYARVADADLGFITAGNVTAEIELPPVRYRTPTEQRQFFDRLIAGLRAVPGVERVTINTSVPPNGGLYFGDLEIEGRPRSENPVRYDGGGVGPGFFESLGVSMVEGRGFVESDLAAGVNAIVVSASTAKKFWPDASAIGKRVRMGQHSPWSSVVGVSANIRTRTSDLESTQIYTASSGEPGFGVVLIHTAADRTAEARAIAAARTLIQTIDPRLPIGRIESLDDAVFRMNVRPRFNALLLGVLACVGLVLAASGVYGVINYSVGLRTRELGVRLALGATPRGLGGAVLREAAFVAAIGVVIGLGAWLVLGRLMASLLYDVEPTDGLTLASVAIVLVATTLVAAWLPARRATSVDPVVALRD
jgi:putative ABC transport system permease protein